MLALAACSPENPDPQGVVETPIVGGQSVDIRSVPWQVSLRDRSGHQCGGSILSATHVLTAAHCVEGSRPNQWTVAAGATRRSEAARGQIRAVQRITLFPGYRSPELGRDAAVLELASPLDLSSPGVAAVAPLSPDEAAAGWTDPGTPAVVTGWGATSSWGGRSPDNLLGASVEIIANETAQAAYRRERITADQLAAGVPGTGGRDACQGDSGGPLVVVRNGEVRLVGIVSWGYGCGDRRYPGMYGRVSSYHAWILDTAGLRPPPPPQAPNPPPAPSPVRGPRLILNEVLANPLPGLDTNFDGVVDAVQDEFIELVNVGDEGFPMAGVTVSDRDEVRVRFSGGVLPPGASLVLYGGGRVGAGFPSTSIGLVTAGLDLDDDGDDVIVRNGGGEMIDGIRYGAGAARGTSITRATDGDPDANWILHSDRGPRASPGLRADGSAL